MLRRTFLSTPAAAALAAQATRDFHTSTAAGAVPDWEAPLFNLPAHSAVPVIAARIELLKNGKTYFVRARTKATTTVSIKAVKN